MVILVHDYLPKYSAEFSQSDANQYLGNSAGDAFPLTDRDKFSFYCELKFTNATITTAEYILGQYSRTGGEQAFYFRRNANERLRLQVETGGGCMDMLCTPIASNWIASGAVLNDTDWHRVLCHVDNSNGTASERLKMWIDGSLDTPNNSQFDFSGDMNESFEEFDLGRVASVEANNSYNGLMGNFALWNGELVALNDIENTDGTLKDIRGTKNLIIYHWLDAGDPTKNWVGEDWVNTNSVTASLSTRN